MFISIAKLLFCICRQRRTYVDNLKSSPILTSKVMMYNYATRNRVGTLHFVWKVPDDVLEEVLSAGNSSVLHKITPSLPVFIQEPCGSNSLKRCSSSI